jgi:hypothetical protein
MVMRKTFSPGDLVVYKKQKRSSSLSARAHDIAPAVQAGKFSYVVDKYWIVIEAGDDGTVVVKTRGGKHHRLSLADPNLRRAKWWQRLWYRSHYPRLAKCAHNSPCEP